jgi:hypothetical protein
MLLGGAARISAPRSGEKLEEDTPNGKESEETRKEGPEKSMIMK